MSSVTNALTTIKKAAVKNFDVEQILRFYFGVKGNDFVPDFDSALLEMNSQGRIAPLAFSHTHEDFEFLQDMCFNGYNPKLVFTAEVFRDVVKKNAAYVHEVISKIDISLNGTYGFSDAELKALKGLFSVTLSRAENFASLMIYAVKAANGNKRRFAKDVLFDRLFLIQLLCLLHPELDVIAIYKRMQTDEGLSELIGQHPEFVLFMKQNRYAENIIYRGFSMLLHSIFYKYGFDQFNSWSPELKQAMVTLRREL